MSSFSELLRHQREQLGLSRAALAHRVAKSTQYIRALEQPDEPRTPSLGTLKDLIVALAPPGDAAHSSLSVKRNLLAAALEDTGLHDLLVTTTLEEELAGQAHASFGSAIWILSDTIAESLSSVHAERTVGLIRERDIKYTYFVPFGAPESHWRRALGWLLKYADMTVVEQHVRVYQVSDCAFSCRMRITNPHANEREAVYSLGQEAAYAPRFCSAPLDLVDKTTDILSELCLIEEEQGKLAESHIAGEPSIGWIRRVFPSRAIDE